MSKIFLIVLVLCLLAFSGAFALPVIYPMPGTMELQCPTTEINDNYSFEWTTSPEGQFTGSGLYLQTGYDANFKRSTFFEISDADKASPLAILRYYQKIINIEKKAANRELFARLHAKGKFGNIYYNVCKFSTRQPVAPTLDCPTTAVNKEYSFSWNSGDYSKTDHLEFSYDANFKKKTSVKATKINPVPITKYFKALYNYQTKYGGKIFARINATEKYGRRAYSNVCEFNIDITPVCSQNSDCGTDGIIDGSYCNGNNVYQKNQTFTCNMPGTIDAYCSSKTTATVAESCKYGCTNGTCNLPAGVIQFQSMPDTVTTNLSLFPVMGYCGWYETKVFINGELQDLGYDDSFFKAVPLSEGSNQITVVIEQEGKKKTFLKNVIFDPNYSTAGKELLYVNFYQYFWETKQSKYYIAVMDRTGKQYLGLIENAEAYGISPNGKILIVRNNSGNYSNYSGRVVYTDYHKDGPAFSSVYHALFTHAGDKMFMRNQIFETTGFSVIGSIGFLDTHGRLDGSIDEDNVVSWDDKKIFFKESWDDWTEKGMIGYYSLEDSKYYPKYSQYSYYKWSGMALTKDDKYLVSTGCSWWVGYIDIFNVETGKKVAHYGSLPDCPAELVVSPDGKNIYVSFSGTINGSYKTGIVIIDGTTLAKKAFVDVYFPGPIAIASDGTLFVEKGDYQEPEKKGIVLMTASGSSLKEGDVFFLSDSENVRDIFYKPAN